MVSVQSVPVPEPAVADQLVPTPVCESLGDEYDDGVDLATDIVTIRKPGRNESVSYDRAAAVRVILLPIDGKKEYEVHFYYVDPLIAEEIADELVPFIALPYYSWQRRSRHIHLVTEPGDSGWGRSMAKLIGQSSDWFRQHKVIVRSNRAAGRYIIKARPLGEKEIPSFSTEPTAELLREALGHDRYIRDRSHPVFQSVAAGEVLE